MYPVEVKTGLALTLVAAVQAVTPSPRQLARAPRPLQPTEVAVILSGSREAIADKTFTLSFPARDEGPQVLMRGSGRPAIVRTAYGISGGFVSGDGSHSEWQDEFIDITDYTGAPARRCDGTAVAGELVITYQHRGSTDTWTASAGTTAKDWNGAPVEIGASIFNILSETTLVSSDVVRQTADGRLMRAFTAPFSVPPHSARGSYGLGDPAAAATQSLWIDTGSLLPVTWEVVVGDRVGYELVFNYEHLDLRPPDGLKPPRCIP